MRAVLGAQGTRYFVLANVTRRNKETPTAEMSRQKREEKDSPYFHKLFGRYFKISPLSLIRN